MATKKTTTKETKKGRHITLHVLGVSEGSTYITVMNRSNGNNCIVKVNVTSDAKPVTDIILSETTLDMQPGGTVMLTATVLPEDAENKTMAWESSKTGVATVSASGLVTGPNGNTIFLPAAGGRWDGELYRAGSLGDYWSRSLYASRSYNAYYQDFYSGNWDWYYDYRYRGFPVRAVRP